MNKKTAMIGAVVLGSVLTVSGCKGDTYQYEVSGTVDTQQLDYENCPKGSLAMDLVAFDAGHGKGNSSGSGSKGDSKSSKGDTKSDSDSKAKADSGSKASPKASSTGRSSGRSTSSTPTGKSSATATKTARPKGVTLNKKPEKPEKVTSVPKSGKWRKGCDTEYEIFVRSDKDGELYEQDVRKVDYENCLEAPGDPKYFPGCTID